MSHRLLRFRHQRMFESVTPRSEGLGTFEEHLAGIRRFYRAQRDEAVKLAHKHLDGAFARVLLQSVACW